MHVSQWVKRRGYRMRLELPAIRCFQGEPLHGSIRFESSSTRETTVRHVRVYLLTQIYSGMPEKVADRMLIKQETLTPLERRDYPFELIVPPSANLGWAGVGLTSSRGLIFHGTTVAIMIAPERRIAAAAELIAALARHEITGWFTSRGIVYRARLSPQADLQNPNMGLWVKVQQNSYGLRGDVRIAHVGIESWLEVEKRSCDLRFETPVDDLSPLRSAMEDFIRRHPRLKRDLPIPAASIIDTQDLPVPSECAGTAS